MKLSFRLPALFSLFFIAGCGAGTSVKNSAALDSMIETEWAGYTKDMEKSAGGLAIYMITPSGTYFSSTHMENASPDAHFRIASNTKTFTSAALMLLQQSGRLNIEDKITGNIPGTDEPYVPDTPDYAIPRKDEITIRQVMEHRAGIFDIDNNVIPLSCNAEYRGQNYVSWKKSRDETHTFTPDELIGVVAHCRLSFFAPGSNYHYSDTGYTLLAEIIERASGQNYSKFVKEHLIDRNGLSDTSAPYLGTETQVPEPYVPGNFLLDKVLYEDTTEDNMSVHVAEGNIISTPADLAMWIRLLVKGRAGLTKESVDTITQCISPTSPVSCYGLGISHVTAPENGIGHSGATPGYLSLMLHDPETDITTIVFTNLLNYDAAVAELALLQEVRGKAYAILGY